MVAVADRPAEPAYSFGRRETRGVLLGLSAAQLACAALAVAALTSGFLSGQLTGGAVSLLVVVPSLVLAFAPAGGRRAVEWTGPLVNTSWQHATGQHQFLGGPLAPPAELVLPGRASRLRVLTFPSGSAVIQDQRANTLTVILEVAASSFVLLDRATQSRRVAAWGGLLAALCHGGRCARIQWLERTIPDSGDSLQQWWRRSGDAASPAAAIYADVIRDAGPAAQRHETFLVMAVDAGRLTRQIRGAGGGLRGITTVMSREMSAFEAAVAAAELTVLGWASPRRLAGIVRTAFDPAVAAHQDCDPPADASVRTPGHAGPMAHETHWEYYRSDSGVHATYWIAEWPRLPVHAGFLQPLLLECGARRTVSLVAQPLAAEKASRQIRRAKVEHLTNAEQRARLGQVADARQDAEYADVLAREAELVAGHGDLRFTGYVSTTVPDEDDLPAAAAAVELAALQSHLELRRLYGQQDQAFCAAALPLALGLR